MDSCVNEYANLHLLVSLGQSKFTMEKYKETSKSNWNKCKM